MKYRSGEPKNETETRDYLNWAIFNAEMEEWVVVHLTMNGVIDFNTLFYKKNLMRRKSNCWDYEHNAIYCEIMVLEIFLAI